jgi:hypothetical protein
LVAKVDEEIHGNGANQKKNLHAVVVHDDPQSHQGVFGTLLITKIKGEQKVSLLIKTDTN